MREKISVGTVRQLTAVEGSQMTRALINSSELVGEMVPIEELQRLRGFEDDARRLHADKMRFYTALLSISCMPDEESEWDGRDKYREVRAMAAAALKTSK
jgi:hypothetical protein